MWAPYVHKLGKETVQTVIQDVGIGPSRSSTAILRSGRAAPNPIEVVGSNRLGELLFKFYLDPERKDTGCKIMGNLN